MAISLGFDTGGTYTDAVILDEEHGVVAAAKALTTRQDLTIGLQNALQAVLKDVSPRDIQLVSLSTTLATNAIVEGKGSPIGLLLIGYDPELLRDLRLESILAREAVSFIPGGHTVTGEEQVPLDWEAARRAILEQASHVAAFGVSGYFAVRNPAHELRVKELVRELTGLPVTCGHELTTRLHAPHRALTVALNARLIPLLRQLVLAVREVLVRHGVSAPLMVVKGDGSLVSAEMALERPVETILSGPAASVVGARFLTGVQDGLVVDMGGTTTDIAVVREGHPVLDARGAQVGNWQTMVEAIAVQTTGLGGDSEVSLSSEGALDLGPRRVIPLSILAAEYPSVVARLQERVEHAARMEGSRADLNDARFILRQQSFALGKSRLPASQQEIWERLGEGPFMLSEFLAGVKFPPLYQSRLQEMVERGYLVTAGFTPTDAVHVLGQYRSGTVEAAELGAQIWALRTGTSAQRFSEQVVDLVRIRAGRAIVASALTAEGIPASPGQDGVAHFLIDRALGADPRGCLDVSFALPHPLVTIGAPAGTYLPTVATQLHARLMLPSQAAVANAIGAVAGGIVQTVRVLIRPQEDGKVYRAYFPEETRDFPSLEAAVAQAEAVARETADERARRAGGAAIQLRVERYDRRAGGGPEGEEIFFDTEIVATAVGRPRYGR